MIKILHLNNYLPYTSGVTRYIYQIVKNTKDIFEHEIICFGGDARSLFGDMQIKITVKNYLNVLLVPAIYCYLWNYCKRNKIDIVHNHHRFFDTITSSFPGRKFTTVTTVHSKVLNWKLFSYKADYLISVSDSITKHLEEHYRKSKNKIYTFKNFVELTNIKFTKSKSDIKNQLTLGENWVILFIGRFDKEKGTDILVKAFEKFYKINNNISLVMIGEGKEEIHIKQFCHENHLPVTFVKPTFNIYDYYNIADVVVLPSRVDPFPFVMLETGLMKKPFIGSKVDGIPELIKHKINGLLFKSENLDELADSFRIIMGNKLFAENISKNLYNDVIKNYTVDKIIPEYIALYNSLV